MAALVSPLPIEVPLSPALLSQRRLKLRRMVPTEGFGAHRHRRMGQSLTFREYRDYQRGDDARTIDWAASHRMSHRVVRTFEAEERRTLFIFVDWRPTMWLPVGADKLTIALWIVQCLYQAAFAEGDRVIVSTLFGPLDNKPVTLNGGRSHAEFLRVMDTLRREGPDSDADWRAEPKANVAYARRLLEPASSVVLITDALFRDTSSDAAALDRAAQQSYRSFHMIELDSWPMEKALLTQGAFRLGGIGARQAASSLTEITEAQLSEAEHRLAQHKAALKRRFQGPGLVWPDQPLSWPETVEITPKAVSDWFANRFLQAHVLPSLWSRAA